MNAIKRKSDSKVLEYKLNINFFKFIKWKIRPFEEKSKEIKVIINLLYFFITKQLIKQ